MAKAPVRTSKGQFAKGVSGNPKGRDQGSRNKVTVAAEALLEGEAEALTRAVIEKAKGGDPACLRLVMERLVPVKRERKIRFDLGKIEGVADHPGAIARIAAAVAGGELVPGEGMALTGMLTAQRQALETADLAERLARIEERLGDAAAR